MILHGPSQKTLCSAKGTQSRIIRSGSSNKCPSAQGARFALLRTTRSAGTQATEGSLGLAGIAPEFFSTRFADPLPTSLRRSPLGSDPTPARDTNLPAALLLHGRFGDFQWLDYRILERRLGDSPWNAPLAIGQQFASRRHRFAGQLPSCDHQDLFSSHAPAPLELALRAVRFGRRWGPADPACSLVWTRLALVDKLGWIASRRLAGSILLWCDPMAELSERSVSGCRICPSVSYANRHVPLASCLWV